VRGTTGHNAACDEGFVTDGLQAAVESVNRSRSGKLREWNQRQVVDKGLATEWNVRQTGTGYASDEVNACESIAFRAAGHAEGAGAEQGYRAGEILRRVAVYSSTARHMQHTTQSTCETQALRGGIAPY